MRRALLLTGLLVACKHTSDTEWGDDPRALGACIGNAQAGAEIPGGAASICFEKQAEDACTARMSFLYMEHVKCAARGYTKQCPNADPTARFQDCGATTTAATSEDALAAAKQVMDIYDAATAAADETAGDCVAFAAKLDPLRDQLLAIGAAHPRVLKLLTTEELQALDAIKKQEAISTKLPACKDNPSTQDFARALTKVM